MVSSELRIRPRVPSHRRASSRTENPITTPATTPASRIPVPVAESRLSLNSAFSGRSSVTTGGTRCTRKCSPGVGIDQVKTPSRTRFTGCMPQRNMNAVRISQGTQAPSFVPRAAPASNDGPATVSCGRHTRSTASTAPMLARAASESTTQGPWKFETRNWVTANAPPAATATGHTPTASRQPPIAQTIQNGMMAENTGSWRPATAESRRTSSPVTWARVVIGMPMLPKATGAVFAMSERPLA